MYQSLAICFLYLFVRELNTIDLKLSGQALEGFGERFLWVQVLTNTLCLGAVLFAFAQEPVLPYLLADLMHLPCFNSCPLLSTSFFIPELGLCRTLLLPGSHGADPPCLPGLLLRVDIERPFCLEKQELPHARASRGADPLANARSFSGKFLK